MSNQLKPGPELDALVAEKVMGWKWMRWHDLEGVGCEFPLRRTLSPPGDYWLSGHENYVEWDSNDPAQAFLEAHGPHRFSPSTSITDAWKVVEKMRSEGWWWSIATCEAGWNVQIGRKVLDQEVAVAETAPHAICLAALKAVGYLNQTEGD